MIKEFGTDGTYIFDNFNNADVILKVEGNFENHAQRKYYAESLCEVLNGDRDRMPKL